MKPVEGRFIKVYPVRFTVACRSKKYWCIVFVLPAGFCANSVPVLTRMDHHP